MNIINIAKMEECNKLTVRYTRAQFLQSWDWGEFQKAVGRPVWRLGFVSESAKVANGHKDDLVAAAQIIKHNLPFGKSYLYVPRFSMVNGQWSKFLDEIKKIAKQENAIFIKIEPVNQISNIKYQISKPVQPQTTLYLDLIKSEEELLLAMHPKTRYNIRLAEKHGVIVRTSNNINEFLALAAETRARDQFRGHPDNYYRQMFDVLGNYQLSIINYQSSCYIKLFSAYYNSQVIASNIVAFFGDTATYLHGASSNEHRHLMAPHLLQWEIIKFAQSQGYKWYDFWGVNPSDSKLKPGEKWRPGQGPRFEPSWDGFTRFKRGFASESTGLEITYPGCFDLPVDRFWYKIYRMAKKFR